MEKKSTKPVRARILLTLLILILAIIFGVIFVYRDNIKALWRGLTTDTGEIGEMIQETQKQTKNALSDAGMIETYGGEYLEGAADACEKLLKK